MADTTPLTFSITLPAIKDVAVTNEQLQNIFSVLDAKIPDSYEMLLLCPETIDEAAAKSLGEAHRSVKIIPLAGASKTVPWNETIGDVLMVVDGDLSKPATALLDVVKDLEGGSDMTLLTRYPQSTSSDTPSFSCFAIKRDSLRKLKTDSHGYRLLEEVFGRDTMKKIVGSAHGAGSGISSFFHHLRSLVHSAS